MTFYEKPMKAWLTILKNSLKNNKKTNPLTVNYYKNVWKSSIVFNFDLKKFFNFKNAQIFYSDHHLSHTLSALYFSPVVVDGFGDHACSSLHHVKSETDILELWTSEYPNSLGLFYSAITDFLGFTVNDGEYQVMGLAAYGKPHFYESLSQTIMFLNNEVVLVPDYFDFQRSVTRSYSQKLVDLLNVQPESNKDLDLDDPHFRNVQTWHPHKKRRRSAS